MPKSFIKQLTLTVILSGALSTALVALPSSAMADTTTGTDAQTQTAVQAGVQYLANNQAADGSITGTGGESEWSAVALTADGQDASDLTNSTSGTSLADFIQTDVPTPTTPATTVERSIIAVAATGGDTANYGGVNYDADLASQDVGSQIGDPTLLNDDAFGVIAADAAGSDALVPVAQDGLNYLLAHQAADGGFSYTTDTCAFCGSDSNDTAAAIIAMYAGEDLGLSQSNPAAQTNALNYLLGTQQADGGFGYDALSPSDGDSTAWALMALNTVGESVAAQAQLARDWLLADQQPDGGFSYGAFGVTASDTYTTAHVLIALLGTNWLLNPAPVHQSPQTGGQGSGSVNQTDQSVQAAGQTAPQATLAAAYTYSAGSANGQTAAASAQTTSGTSQSQTATDKVVTSKQTPKTIATTTNKSSTKYTVYAVVVLILVALGWFVLESQKDRGVK
jgi:hypothetical protein